jgi:large repetitive protein
MLISFGASTEAASAAGPPASVTVHLSPASIPADGISTSTVTVTVTDASGAGVLNQVVTLVTSPPNLGITFSAPHGNGDGTYTSTLTSSSVPAKATIVAADGLLTGAAYLTQTAPTATSLTAVTGGTPPVTNQSVTLLATITSAASSVTPSGVVAFENGGTPISGCGAVPTPAQSSPVLTVACGTSFAAAASPASLTAVFSPGSGSLATGSTSPPDSLPIGKDSTSTSVTLVGSQTRVNQPLRFKALITPSQQGPAPPTGAVQFSDHGKPIRACRSRPVGPASAATCIITYAKPGAHAITATYLGDPSFSGSSTLGAATVAVQALGTVKAAMQWTFYYTPTFTQVLALTVTGAPPRAKVLVWCHGKACPFARRAIPTGRSTGCGPRGRQRCLLRRTIDLTHLFRRSHLAIGARIRVEIVKPGWIGKNYVFTVIAGHGPVVRIS